MNRLLVFCILSFYYYYTSGQVHLDTQQKDLLKQMEMQCIYDTNVDPDFVLQLKANNWNMDNFGLKKWVLCVLVKAELMTKEGVFKMDDALSKIPDEEKTQIEQQIDDCLPSKTALPPEIAWDYAKCYHINYPTSSLL